MSKFIAFFLCLFIGSKSFSQSVYDRFYPTAEASASINDTRVREALIKYPQISTFGLDESSITSLETRSGYLTITGFKLTSTYSYASVVYNSQSNDYMLYFSTSSFIGELKKSKIYDETGNYLYEIGLESGRIVVTASQDLSSASKAASCFSVCFHAQEDNFEDTFTGWVAWNTNPHIQFIAAGNCQGCCQGWWSNAGCH